MVVLQLEMHEYTYISGRAITISVHYLQILHEFFISRENIVRSSIVQETEQYFFFLPKQKKETIKKFCYLDAYATGYTYSMRTSYSCCGVALKKREEYVM